MSRAVNPPLLKALRADAIEFAKVKKPDHQGPSAFVDIMALPGFWCVVLWRLSNFWHERGLKALSRMAYFANVVLFGADLAPGAVVGPGVIVPHPVGLGVGAGVVLGARCKLMGLVRIGGAGRADRLGFATIGDEVWLLDGARVFGPVTIGSRSVIGSLVVVTQDVPPDTTVKLARQSLEIRPNQAYVSEPSP